MINKIEEKLNIIYISYYFPPIHSIAVQRNYNIVNSLANLGNRLFVLTTSNKYIFPKDDKVLKGVDISCLMTFDYRTILSFIMPRRNNIHFSSEQKSNRLLKWLIKVNESIPFNLLFGEGGLIYILHGLIKIKKISTNIKSKPIVIITSFRPTANIIIGYLYKILKKDVFWIVSFHDAPYLEKRNNLVLVEFQEKCWKFLFRKADLVFTVTKGVGQAIKNYQVNPIVLLNGINVRTPKSLKNNKFIITFTGSLYKDLIDPEILFKATETLIENGNIDKENIEIIYAGKDGKEWTTWANNYPKTKSIITSKGIVNNEEAYKLQESSNINLMLTWNDKNYSGNLTGKFYEYVGALNPILAIVKGQHDNEIEDSFRELKCGTIIYEYDHNSIENTMSFILQNYKCWKEGNFINAINKVENISSHSWQSRAQDIEDIICKSINNQYQL